MSDDMAPVLPLSTRSRGGQTRQKRPPRQAQPPRQAKPSRQAQSPRQATGTVPRESDERREPQQPRRTSFVLAALAALLCLVGLVMVLSVSAAQAQNDYGSPWYQFQRQAVWLLVGAVGMFIAMRVDYRRWRSFANGGVLVTLALLALVLVPSLGTTINGASRWLVFGPISIQPSELAKLSLILFAADLLARREHRIDESRLTVRPVLTVFTLMGALLLIQPSLGTTALLFALALVLLFVSGAPTRPLMALLAAGAALGGLLALFEPYRIRRLLAFSDPWSDPLNAGYQTLQSQAALANGGVTGQGLGQGRAKFGFLPEGHTDFIFSNIGEELGLLGSVLLVGVFVAIGVLGVSVALRAPDRFSTLMAAGITAWICLQAFVNLGAAVGLLPITGMPLPFVSSGGSSLIVTMLAFGILCNIARQADRAAVEPQAAKR